MFELTIERLARIMDVTTDSILRETKKHPAIPKKRVDEASKVSHS